MTISACDAILATVATERGLRPRQMLCTGRGHNKGAHWQYVHRAQHEAMARMRAAGASMPVIARALRMRSHEPVVRGLRMYESEKGEK